MLRQNGDLTLVTRPAQITPDRADLFDRHKRRFKWGVPDSIYDFLSDEPATVPCDALEFDVHLDDRLIAVSYFDVGE